MIIAPNKSDFLGQLDDDVTPIGWDVTVTYATPAGAAAVGTVQPFSGIGTAQAGGAFQQDYQALFGVNVQSTALLGANGLTITAPQVTYQLGPSVQSDNIGAGICGSYNATTGELAFNATFLGGTFAFGYTPESSNRLQYTIPYATNTIYPNNHYSSKSTNIYDEFGDYTLDAETDTGYIGPNTGYTTPSEMIGAPNALETTRSLATSPRPLRAAPTPILSSELRRRRRKRNRDIQRWGTRFAFRKCRPGNAELRFPGCRQPGDRERRRPLYFPAICVGPSAQAPGGVDPYTFQQSAPAAAQDQSGWALPGFEGAVDNGATQTQSGWALPGIEGAPAAAQSGYSPVVAGITVTRPSIHFIARRRRRASTAATKVGEPSRRPPAHLARKMAPNPLKSPARVTDLSPPIRRLRTAHGRCRCRPGSRACPNGWPG